MNRNNKILILLLVLLLALFLVIRHTRDTRERRIRFFDINLDLIGSIEMKTASDSLLIVRDGFEWVIEYPFFFEVDERRLNNFFETVLPVETSSIPVALSEDSFRNYQVTEAHGTMLSFYDRNRNLLDRALVGRSGRIAYARRPDDNRVFQLSENIAFFVNPNLNPWRSKEIVSIPRGQIQELEVTYLLNQYRITATDSLWLFRDNEFNFSVPENNQAMGRILAVIENMVSYGYEDFLYEEFQEKLADPQLILNIRLFDGTEKTLRFALIEETNFVVQKNDVVDHLSLIDADTVDLFTKSPQHFQ